MKKLFKYIFLTIILLNYLSFAHADCNDDIDFKWFYATQGMAEFEFLNNTNRSIKIESVTFYTSDNQIVKSSRPYDPILRPFGKKTHYETLYDINTKFIKTAGYKCTYSNY